MGVGWVQFDIPAEHIAFPLALAPVQSIPSQSMVDRMEGVGGLVVGWKIEVDVDVDVDSGQRCVDGNMDTARMYCSGVLRVRNLLSLL